ncbi:EthD family reductase [Novosphingobium sp. 1949]|uniref:EthD family reductase n=1 Tax=Novosphingobium organovorum TaxID=2930092 RepID=A0ABT0BCW4_9SPHN|nr:EthD family reductase [Novosphingobium organovorum]MCJ2182641.1 EthD family reductase [Novosphingobium organovorum]
MPQVVLNVLYNAPADPAAFEAYYASTHLPIAQAIPSLANVVLLKGVPGPDGSAPPYYRMAQLFFADAETMAAAMGSEQGQAAVADLANFASGGVRVLVAEVA